MKMHKEPFTDDEWLDIAYGNVIADDVTISTALEYIKSNEFLARGDMNLNEIVIPNDLPEYASKINPKQTIEMFANFIKDDVDNFTIGDVGEVDLSSVLFSLVASEECFTAYDPRDEAYYTTNKDNAKAIETIAAVMLLECEDDFYIRPMFFRSALRKIPESLHAFNTNEQLLETMKNTKLVGAPYLINFASVTLKMRSAKQSGFSYQKPNVRLAELSADRTKRAAEFFASQHGRDEYATCQEVMKRFLSEVK